MELGWAVATTGPDKTPHCHGFSVSGTPSLPVTTQTNNEFSQAPTAYPLTPTRMTLELKLLLTPPPPSALLLKSFVSNALGSTAIFASAPSSFAPDQLMIQLLLAKKLEDIHAVIL